MYKCRKGNPLCTVSKIINCTTWKTVWRCLKTLRIELPNDPAFHCWDTVKANGSTNLERYLHPHNHCNIVYNSQDMEEN